MASIKPAKKKRALIDVDLVIKIGWGVAAFAVFGVIPWFALRTIKRKQTSNENAVKDVSS